MPGAAGGRDRQCMTHTRAQSLVPAAAKQEQLLSQPVMSTLAMILRFLDGA